MPCTTTRATPVLRRRGAWVCPCGAFFLCAWSVRRGGVAGDTAVAVMYSLNPSVKKSDAQSGANTCATG